MRYLKKKTPLPVVGVMNNLQEDRRNGSGNMLGPDSTKELMQGFWHLQTSGSTKPTNDAHMYVQAKHLCM